MELLIIDFESYFNTAEKYTLNRKAGGVSMLEYIRSPQFKAHGIGVGTISADGKIDKFWVTGSRIQEWADGVDWANTTAIAHNAKFDGAILAWIYGKIPAGFICTQSMARAILGTKVASHSLAKVAEHFGFPPKGEMKTDGIRDLTPEQEAELSIYGLHDVELCGRIYQELSKHFPAAQYEVLDWTMRCFIEPQLDLDEGLLKEAHEKEKERRTKIFEEIGIEKKVFSSNDQFSELLASKGFEVPMKKSPKQKNADGTAKLIPALSVSDPGFMELREAGNPELDALCEARIAAKSNLLETRSASFLKLVKYGHFPFDIGFSGAKQTHRFNGEGGAGGNPQNLTRGSVLRKAVKAPEGYKLLVADYATIELRIQAWLARESKLINPILEGKDVYSEFAGRIYQRLITKLDKIERQFGKCAVLGLGYNMGAKKFRHQVRVQTGMVISQEEAERVVSLYRMYYSRIPALWATLDHYIPYLAKGVTAWIPGVPFLEIRGGCVILPSGLKLQYPNLRQFRKGERLEWVYDVWDKGHLVQRNLYGGKLLENICQALAGEICKLGISRARAAGIRAAGQVHDEVLAAVLAAMAKAKAEALQTAMEAPVPWWPTMKLKAEVGVGDNWLEAKL